MQSWTAPIDLSSLDRVEVPQERVFVVTSEEGPSLQPGHVILATYRTVEAMYSRRPGFFTSLTTIMLSGQEIGCTGILSECPVSGSCDSTTFDSPSTVHPHVLNSTSTSVADDSGVIVDPEDPRFSIHWEVDGRSVPAQEWLSSVMDGLAAVALHESDAKCAFITGVSFSGNTAFHVGEESPETLLCGQISKAFAYLYLVTLKSRKFMEIDFKLKYDAATIGTGYVLRISSVESHSSNSSTARIATSTVKTGEHWKLCSQQDGQNVRAVDGPPHSPPLPKCADSRTVSHYRRLPSPIWPLHLHVTSRQSHITPPLTSHPFARPWSGMGSFLIYSVHHARASSSSAPIFPHLVHLSTASYLGAVRDSLPNCSRNTASTPTFGQEASHRAMCHWTFVSTLFQFLLSSLPMTSVFAQHLASAHASCPRAFVPCNQFNGDDNGQEHNLQNIQHQRIF